MNQVQMLPVLKDGEKIYDIHITDTFDDLAVAMKNAGLDGRKICIVADSNVAPLYAQTVKNECDKISNATYIFHFMAGEEYKTLDTVRSLYTYLIEEKFDRNDILVALGGGVTGDLTGYTAATYLRGIRFMQIPTTLLSQVDSSIGGKTGVDFDQYKNMVGAFHMPKLVYMNVSTLNTLPDVQFASGMAEILKHGCIKDKAYFEWLLSNSDEITAKNINTMKEMILRSCFIKKQVVENDPFEKGERALLNFGHTIGHAIEKLMNFRMLHGECVSIGCIAASYLSCKKGYIKQEQVEQLKKDFMKFHLPVSFKNLDEQAILAATKSDKKMDNGKIKFVLLEEMGKAKVNRDISDEELLEAISYVKE